MAQVNEICEEVGLDVEELSAPPVEVFDKHIKFLVNEIHTIREAKEHIDVLEGTHNWGKKLSVKKEKERFERLCNRAADRVQKLNDLLKKMFEHSRKNYVTYSVTLYSLCHSL